MSEWVSKPLGELVTFAKGTKADVVDEPGEGLEPYIGAASLENGAFSQWANPSGSLLADPTDVLMLWDGERSGLVGGGHRGVVASTVARLRPARGISPRFLTHALQSRFTWIQGQRTGTGVPHVPKDLGKLLVVEYPRDIQEQELIAKVLDAFDTAIRVAEQMVEKLREASIASLVDLLTRGRAVHPAEDVESNSAAVSAAFPDGWSTAPIAELLAPVFPAMRSGPFGSALLKQELVDSGVPLLGIDNVHVDRFVTEFERFVTPAKAQALARYLVRPNDVMITIMGTVGRSCLVPDDIGIALSSKHVWTLTIDSRKYRPYLVSRQLNHAPWARAQLRRDEQGGIMSAIRSETLKRLVLPVPPLEEQVEIEGVLRAFDRRIASAESYAKKLKATKFGVAADLLRSSGVLPVLEGSPA